MRALSRYVQPQKNKTALVKSRSVDAGVEDIELQEKLEQPEEKEVKSPQE